MFQKRMFALALVLMFALSACGPAVPGGSEWVADTDKSTFSFSVSETGKNITKMSYKFNENVGCGFGEGTIIFIDVPVTKGEFHVKYTNVVTYSNGMIGRFNLYFNGSYDSENNKFTGTWVTTEVQSSGSQDYDTDLCNGDWQAISK